ncbi:MAG: efflux RND transporter periplasmic adaptor subunit, partial [Alphaproteobacteria bacterium]|nr:efflux RND transporter periplasmic adaptor subunit [Alphaproteobacteria bacterium]
RDQAAARLEAALAGGHVAQAALASAIAQVAQREAAVEQARVDLDRTDIRSPVDGVVVERSVDLGQTVAASLQAPTLFTIARDLGRMQVDVSVDEADIGRVRQGAKAGFTVDAHPGRHYEGRVEQIRLAPTVTQNVVTYTVVVTADNPDRSLLPGLTAEVRIVDQARADALLLPNAALRFHPPGEHVRGATVWLPGPDGRATPQPVKTGIADGAVTEVLSGLDEGQTVIVGGATAAPSRKSGGLGFGFGR